MNFQNYLVPNVVEQTSRGERAAPRVSGVTGEKDLAALRLDAPERLEEVLEFLDAGGAPAGAVLAHRAAGFGLLLIARENAHGLAALRADMAARRPRAAADRRPGRDAPSRPAATGVSPPAVVPAPSARPALGR